MWMKIALAVSGLIVLCVAVVWPSPGGRTSAATPTVQTAPTLKARVGDIDVAYRVYGHGQPLLLITGFSASMDLWDPTLLGELAQHYLVVTFDNRGIGGTSAGDGPYPFSRLADDTAGLIDALNLGRPHVLGWSIGGSVAQDLALRYPEKVNRLILYATDCGGSAADQPAAAVIQQLTDTSGTPQQRGERLLSLILPPTWLRQNFAYVARVFFRPMEAISPAAVARQGEAIAAWPGVCDRLGEIRAATLVLHGDDDLIEPVANAPILANGIRGSWMVRLASGGHGMMYQYPRRVARLVLEFLGE
jgi:pimeloyl-ACP methyl ester carboxylesterase